MNRIDCLLHDLEYSVNPYEKIFTFFHIGVLPQEWPFLVFESFHWDLKQYQFYNRDTGRIYRGKMTDKGDIFCNQWKSFGDIAVEGKQYLHFLTGNICSEEILLQKEDMMIEVKWSYCGDKGIFCTLQVLKEAEVIYAITVPPQVEVVNSLSDPVLVTFLRNQMNFNWLERGNLWNDNKNEYWQQIQDMMVLTGDIPYLPGMEEIGMMDVIRKTRVFEYKG